MATSPPKRALVLSGGGARGAYEAGILRYIMEVLPDHVGRHPRFSIICGTSVGAINAAWLAATINDPRKSAHRLWYLWKSLNFLDVVQISYMDVVRMAGNLFGLGSDAARAQLTGSREGGFLRTSFFDSVVRREIPFHNIKRNIRRGLFESLSVSATDIVTGRTTIFVQSGQDRLPPWTRDPRRLAIPGPITSEKVLASAAIPLLFPAVKIGQHWFCDGGLRQNTPIAPALRLGAERVMVISLQSGSKKKPTPFEGDASVDVTHPNLAFLLGKLLDALLLDPLDYDLAVLERINALLRHGEEAFPEDEFVEKLNEVLEAHRGQGYRVVDTLLVRPSADLGEVANDFAMGVPDAFWGSKLMSMVGKRAVDLEGYRESDFLSYLLFDGGYTGELLELGYGDAAARHDELVAFFED